MSEFLRSTSVKSTRKPRRCFACNEMIDKGSPAVEWVSVDGGSVNSTYVHPECWNIFKSECSGCRHCNDDGYHEGFIRESLSSGYECKGVKAWLEINKRNVD